MKIQNLLLLLPLSFASLSFCASRLDLNAWDGLSPTAGKHRVHVVETSNGYEVTMRGVWSKSAGGSGLSAHDTLYVKFNHDDCTLKTTTKSEFYSLACTIYSPGIFPLVFRSSPVQDLDTIRNIIFQGRSDQINFFIAKNKAWLALLSSESEESSQIFALTPNKFTTDGTHHDGTSDWGAGEFPQRLQDFCNKNFR